MAISVINRPIVYSPVLNDIVLTLDSTEKTFCSMNYRVKVFVNSAPISTLSLFPNETNGYASFKVDELLLDYLQDDVYAGLRGATTDTGSLLELSFWAGDYSDGTTGCTGGTFSGSLSSLTGGTLFNIWKGGLGWEQFYNYDWTDYVVASGASATANPIKFLTNAPETVTTHLGAENYLTFMQGITAAGGIPVLQILTTDESGATAAYYLPNAYSTGTQVARRKITMGVGPDNLNRTSLTNISGATVSGPYITATTKSYTVTGGNISGSTFTPYTETKRYELDNSCFRFTPYRVLWVNTLGGIDAYTFRGNHFESYNSERSDYTKRAAGLQADNTWGYQLDSRGRVTYHNRVNKSVKTWTHWLTQEEFEWLSTELRTSSINAFVSAVNENEDPAFFNFNLPINITTAQSQIVKKGSGPQTRSLDLDFTFSFPEITQRG